MKIKTLIAVAVAAAFAVPFAAQASVDGDKLIVAQAKTGGAAAGATAGMLERLDKNKDGFVSRDEAKDEASLNTRFSELDKDNDGKLSRSELEAMGSGAGAAGGTSGAAGSSSGQAPAKKQ